MECIEAGGCTLEGAEMAERIRAWQAVSSRAVSREVRDDGITSVYPADPELIGRLTDLIAAEAVCCSFLEFTIQEEGDRVVVELTFPEEARGVVERVLTIPAGAS